MDNLLRAWHHIRARLEQEGWRTSQHEVRRLELDLGSNLRRLSDALLEGTWAPRPLHRSVVREPDGQKRTLRIPPLLDRIAERAIVQTLTPIIDPWLSPCSFAYRPGFGVGDALQLLALLRDEGYDWVVRADIRHCFDRLSHRLVLERLPHYLHDPWLTELVETLITRPDAGQATRPQVGLPQGSPLSPLLANMALDEFDIHLLEAGHPVVRFADDFTLLATNHKSANRALGYAKELLSDMGLEIRTDKTAVRSFAQGFTFLGNAIGPVNPAFEIVRARDGNQLKKGLYVARDGAGVIARKGHLVVTDGNTDLLHAPLTLIDHIVLVGSVGLSAGARSAALYASIPVTFLSRRGRWLGRLDGGSAHNASLRRSQYRFADDETKRLGMATTFVLGKIANQRSLLLRYARRIDNTAVAEAARRLAATRHNVLVS